MDQMNLNLSTTLRCRIHPVVLFNILDHHIRRQEGQERAIGTLVGEIKEGLVEIRNSFGIPFTEDAQPPITGDFHRTMLELHHRVSPKEVLVGWYSTTSTINKVSTQINEFYTQEMQQNQSQTTQISPIHLTLETDLKNLSLSIKTYTSTFVSFPSLAKSVSSAGDEQKTIGWQFIPITNEIKTTSTENTALDLMNSGRKDPSTPLLSDLDLLDRSVAKLQDLLDTILAYINSVLTDQIKPDNNVGRFLADVVASLPKLDPNNFDRMFNTGVQDMLMLVYLANLARTQLKALKKVV